MSKNICQGIYLIDARIIHHFVCAIKHTFLHLITKIKQGGAKSWNHIKNLFRNYLSMFQGLSYDVSHDLLDFQDKKKAKINITNNLI